MSKNTDTGPWGGGGGPVPVAREELERLRIGDLKFIVKNWEKIDPKGGIYTFPHRKGIWGPSNTALKHLSYCGAFRHLSREKIRDMAEKILRSNVEALADESP